MLDKIVLLCRVCCVHVKWQLHKCSISVSLEWKPSRLMGIRFDMREVDNIENMRYCTVVTSFFLISYVDVY